MPACGCCSSLSVLFGPMAEPVPDLYMAARHLQSLYRSTDVLKMVVLGPPALASRRTVPELRFVTARDAWATSPPSVHLRWAAEKNRVDHDVYLGVNPVGRRPDAKSRPRYGVTLAHVERFACVHLDLDRDAHRGLSTLRDDVIAGVIAPPTSVVRTSRGPNRYQLVWQLDSSAWGDARSSSARDRVADVNRALVRRYGGDPAAVPSSALFRLPGYVNRKLSYEDRAEIVATGPVRRLAGLARTGPLSPGHFDSLVAVAPPPRPLESSRSVRSSQSPPGSWKPFISARAAGTRSQSEADWAVACQQLEAGRPADQVLHSLAAYRDQQARIGRLPAKRSLLYYAAHTVQKAADRLGVRRPSLSPSEAAQADAAGARPFQGGAPLRPVPHRPPVPSGVARARRSGAAAPLLLPVSPRR